MVAAAEVLARILAQDIACEDDGPRLKLAGTSVQTRPRPWRADCRSAAVVFVFNPETWACARCDPNAGAAGLDAQRTVPPGRSVAPASS